MLGEGSGQGPKLKTENNLPENENDAEKNKGVKGLKKSAEE